MSHYKSNVRDLEFNLFEVFGAGERMGNGPFAEMDADTAKEILHEVDRLAVGPLAETFAEADRTPPVYDPQAKTVTMPEGFKKSFRAHGLRVVAARPPRAPRWQRRTPFPSMGLQ